MTRASLVGAALLASSIASTATMARAESPESTEHQAVKLFDEGNSFYRESKFAEAEERFQGSYDLKPSHDVAANLGDCELRLGQHRDAAEHLYFARTSFPTTGKKAQRQAIDALLARAKKEVVTLRIKLSETQGVTVVVDGREYAGEILPPEVFVDAGAREVVVSLPGRATDRHTINGEAGSHHDVVIKLDVVEGTDQASTMPAWISYGGWVGIGVGVAMGIAGGVLLQQSGQKKDDAIAEGNAIRGANAECRTPTAGFEASCGALASLTEDVEGLHNAGLGLSITAGVLLVGGAVVTYLGAKGSAHDEQNVRLVPMVGPGVAALTREGRF